MSGEKGELYNHHVVDHYGELSSLFSNRSAAVYSPGPPTGSDAPFYGFEGFFHGSMDYDMMIARALDGDALAAQNHGADGAVKRELLVAEPIKATNNSGGVGGGNSAMVDAGGGGTATPVTPNSSMTSSSSEGAGEEDSGKCKKDRMKEEGDAGNKEQDKGDQDDGDKTKKV